jgi:hypothetical protein
MSVEAQKERLRKATEEFESFFNLQMLKAMRSTIPESDLIGSGLGKDVYTSMFDQELAKRMAGASDRSISEILYRDLVKFIDAQDAEAEQQIRPTGSGRPIEIVSDEKAGGRPDSSSVNNPPTVFDLKEKLQVTRGLSNAKTATDPVLNAFGRIILDAADRFEVNPRLIHAIILTESGGDPKAVSAKGAKGLMQLMDSTAEEMGVTDSLDARQNIHGGAKYLRQLLDVFDGNVRLALAAYNAGPGAVSKYNGVPPYPETTNYVEKVLARLHGDGV